ncbi:MAG: PEP-CTERM sorting domain-containing protein [Planctomycetota bacterium]
MLRSRNLMMASAAATVAFAGLSSAQYVQLVDLSTIQNGGGGNLVGGQIIGTTGYALLGGSGTSRLVEIADIGGANTVTDVITSSELDTLFARTGLGASGSVVASGTNIYIFENTSDQIAVYDTLTDTATLLLDEATFTSSLGFGAVNPVSGNVFFYNSSADSIVELTGVNLQTTVLTDTQLATVAADDTPSGMAFDSSGTLYLGEASASGGEGVYEVDLTGPTGSLVLTEADVIALNSGTDLGGSNTAFNVLSDGSIVFFNSGAPDDIVSYDPSTDTAEIVVTEEELLAGPALRDFAASITEFDGEVAWVNTLTVAGGQPGFYAIPEPATVALLAIGGGLIAAHRRRA